MYFDIEKCGKRIRQLRCKQGLTQLQLSMKINVSSDHLGAIERGKKAASIDLLIEIAEYFHTSLDYLILGKENMHEELIHYELEEIGIHLEKLKKLV
ncbi:MAG: helix-turn-helix domain-containing protein [Fusicatenibacter sp.]